MSDRTKGAAEAAGTEQVQVQDDQDFARGFDAFAEGAPDPQGSAAGAVDVDTMGGADDADAVTGEDGADTVDGADGVDATAGVDGADTLDGADDADATTGADEGDLEELRRRAASADANLGRLRQAQERIRELESRQARPAGGDAPAADAPGMLAEVPEDLRDDVAAFQKANPELADLMLEDGRDGRHLRGVLEEYGPEHVMTREVAERIHDKREAARGRDAARAEAVQGARQAHYDAIFAAHPDYAEMARGGEATKGQLAAFHEGMKTWAEGLPYKDGEHVLNVMAKGSTQEVIEVMTQYKKQLRGQDVPRRHEAARAGMVPRSKSGPPPRPRPSKDDFDAGFDAAE